MHTELALVETQQPATCDAGMPAACAGPVGELIAALDAAGVRFCHWKSNIRLGHSLEGGEDLDLLVHRGDAESFVVALLGAGFKLARSASNIGHPGVFHAFALDETRARLLHVHAYFQIITGDSLVKSYRLPLEDVLLSHTRVLMGVRVPKPEVELALFALRIALKHTDPIETAMANRGYGEVVRELAWLEAAADRCTAAALWCAWIPGAEPESFDAALAAIADPRAIFRRVALGWRLARLLRGWRRLGPASAALSRWRRVAVMALGRIRRRRDLTLQTGGLIVAIVGPKATGKSTLGVELAKRLSTHLDVRRVHAGKPPATALSFGPRLMIPLARALFPRERPSEYEKPEKRSEAHYSVLYVLRMTLLAYDRRALIRRCWRAAAAGAIVVTDRYPSGTVGAIDSGCFDDAAIAACGSPPKRWLMRCERALCAGLPQPDLVVRLVVAKATAVRRDAERTKDGGPDADAVLRRWEIETYADFSPTPVVTINTDRPLEETAANVTRSVWAGL